MVRACCACSRCGTDGLYIYIFFSFNLSSISNVLSFWETAEHDWNIVVSAVKPPTVVVSYCRGRPRLVLVNRLEGLSLPRNGTTVNWPARHDLVVDWVVKPQHKQNHELAHMETSFRVQRMALRWIISILSEYVCVYGLHTVEAGRIRVLGVPCSLMNTGMFGFNVSFDKSKWFVCIRGNSVYVCMILKFRSHLVFEFNAPIVRKDKSLVSHDRQICVVSIFACRRILQCIREYWNKGK